MIITALDGIFLSSINKELVKELLGGKVSKINQPEKDEIIITIRNNKNNYKLLVSASPVYPRAHLTFGNRENPIKAPMFCMVLRKYLASSKISKIEQIETDRILIFEFLSQDELGFDSKYKLIIEIMGRHSNISLIRDRDNIIMDSIKHVTPDINRVRSLLPGISFIYPPASNKLNPLISNEEDVSSYININNIQNDENIYSNVFTGISRPLSKELFNKFPDIDNELNALKNKLNNCFDFYIYTKNYIYKDFHCINLDNLGYEDKIKFDSPSKLLENFYLEKDKQDRLKSKRANLEKLLLTNIERCSKKIRILEDNLEKAKGKDKYKLLGELLTANIYSVKRGDTYIEVSNYYSDTGEIIKINLDINKSPSQNIQKYFKRYNKLKTTESMSKEQLKNAEEELLYLNSVLNNLLNVENYTEIEEIKYELMESSYIKHKKSKNQKNKKDKKVKASNPMEYLSSEGVKIYVGKNNVQNDYLTLKFADKRDTWLHTKNIAGSHVIIKSMEFSEKTLNEAAILAAFYSKGKDSSKVPVDYTIVKNVKKPSGSKPGMVIYYTNKTIYVTPPKEILLERIK
ncbi:MAG: NFACT family protein [Clostridiaceae bacterium]